jgi:hypothetical protein
VDLAVEQKRLSRGIQRHLDFQSAIQTHAGDVDSTGLKIEEIFYAHRDYLLYRAEGKNVVGFMGHLDADQLDSLSKIRPVLSRIYAVLVSGAERKRFLDRIATAMNECFLGDGVTEINILENVEKSALNYQLVMGRLLYIAGCACLVLADIGCVVIRKAYSYTFNEPIKDLAQFVIIATFGSFGGLISVAIKMRELDIDLGSGRAIHVFTGFSRIFISMISAIILFGLIRGNLLVGFVNELPDLRVVYGLSVLAGFSEKFIPDVLRSIEKGLRDQKGGKGLDDTCPTK